MSDPQEQQAQGQPEQAPEQPEAIPAIGFLVLAFVDENAADQALEEMKAAKKAKEFYFEDAAVVRRDANGKVHYHETGDMSAGRGAGVGAIVGGVLGLLGGPAGVALGAGVGAAAGAALASHDAGFKNESLETVGVALTPGTSAIACITSDAFLRAVHKQVPPAEIHTMVSNLALEISRRLNAGMNMAIGLLLTEQGLAVREVAANADRAEVIGAVVTDDVIAVGAAVATREGAAYEVAVATDEGEVVEVGVLTDEGMVVADAVVDEQGESAPVEAPESPAPDQPAAPPASEAPAEPPGR